VGFIGGDLRQLTVMNKFRSAGYNVKIYGYEGAEFSVSDINEIYDCDIILFPMPGCRGNKIFAPFTEEDIFAENIVLPAGKIIFYAGGNELLENKMKNSGSLCFNYMNREELIIKNAVPTAEGAIEIAINETPYTISGARILITGFGRVAKALANCLKAFGADVTVAARKCSAQAEAECLGFNAIDINKMYDCIGDFDVIYNTVPALVIDECLLRRISNDSLIIDLASKPGGVDFEAAQRNGKRVIWALSLPGKVAPVTAGNIIFETVMNILNETEVSLK